MRALRDAAPGQYVEHVRILACSSPRLALVVEATTSRSDCREVRAALLLMLLALRCPERGRPRRSWYVPGAVARLSVAALRRAWAGFHGGEAPSERALRRHLVALEGSLALVRSPGELLPTLRRGEHQPRYPDTIHILEEERDAEWWAARAELLARNPKARRSASEWRRLFGNWRLAARSRQLELFDGVPAAEEVKSAQVPLPAGELVVLAEERAARVAAALDAEPLDLLAVLDRSGARFAPRAQLELLRAPARLRRAAALLALAWRRGDTVRSPGAWLLAAARRASEREGSAAVLHLGGRRTS